MGDNHYSIGRRHWRSTRGNGSRQLHVSWRGVSALRSPRPMLPWPTRTITERRVTFDRILAKITYCLRAWSGLWTAADHTRLNSSPRLCTKIWHYSLSDRPTRHSIHCWRLRGRYIQNILLNPQLMYCNLTCRRKTSLHYSIQPQKSSWHQQVSDGENVWLERQRLRHVLLVQTIGLRLTDICIQF